MIMDPVSRGWWFDDFETLVHLILKVAIAQKENGRGSPITLGFFAHRSTLMNGGLWNPYCEGVSILTIHLLRLQFTYRMMHI